MGLGLDYNDNFIKEVSKVSADDVSAMAELIINSPKLTVIIAPDKFRPADF